MNSSTTPRSRRSNFGLPTSWILQERIGRTKPGSAARRRVLASIPGEGIGTIRPRGVVQHDCFKGNVTQVRTVDRARLTERIGALSPVRLQQVLSGLALVFGWDFADNE